MTASSTPISGTDALAQQQVVSIGNAATCTLSAGKFIFFAAFDGTNNDRLNVNPQEQSTNVGQLFVQVKAAAASDSSGNVVAQYYPGPGTAKSTMLSSVLPTVEGRNTGEAAYQDFVDAARKWLSIHKDQNPNPLDAISIAVTSFSRGASAAAIFSQLLFENGLTAADGKILIPPALLGVSAAVIYDPVETGMQGNMAFAPNTQNMVVIRAENEYRYLYKAADYTAQQGAETFYVPGNHCDIGGSYKDNGLDALMLQAGTTFFQNSGLTISEVPSDRQYNEAHPLVVHSEGTDSYGKQQWSEYGAYGEYTGSRLTDPNITITPAAGNATAGTFQDYSGKILTYSQDGQQSTIIRNYFNGTTTTTTINMTGDGHLAQGEVIATNSNIGLTYDSNTSYNNGQLIIHEAKDTLIYSQTAEL